jgi:hypothetical protein
MDPVSVLREKVMEYLPKFIKSYEVRDDGRIVVRQGSTAVFVEMYPFNDDHSILRLAVPVLFKVPESEALHRKFNELNKSWYFGRIYLDDDRIMVDHILLGDYLDLDELASALTILAIVCDDLDDKLMAEFGGKRFIDG